MENRENLKLPEWMQSYRRKDLEENMTNKSLVETTKQRQNLENKFTSCRNFYEIAECCEELLKIAEVCVLVLGLDLEWPNFYKSVFKTKQIHLCYGENECAFLKVSDLAVLPKAFTLLLKHSNVHLIGYNIHKDLHKLGKDFSFQVDEIITKLKGLEHYMGHNLTCLHNWSIKSVVEKKEFHAFQEEPKSQVKKFTFKGLINFANTINDCGIICEKLLNIVESFPESHNLVIGFDVEWPFSFKAGPGKVALIQLCPEKKICFLFQVSSFKALPKSLHLLLKHPRIKLSGLNIANDIRKIGRDFKIEVQDIIQQHIIELNSLANEKLNTSHRWSLDRLVLNQLNMVLEKPKNIRVSNWNADHLKNEQLVYAASDAYASLEVYNHLMKAESPNILYFFK